MATAGGGGKRGNTAPVGPNFDFSECVKKYLEDVFKSAPSGMKALLVDTDTMKVLSAVYNHSDLLKFEVVLVETLGEAGGSSDAGRTLQGVKANGLDQNDDGVEMVKEAAEYLSCVVLMRPTSHSVSVLAKEIQSAYFSEYHLVFTNLVDTDYLTKIGASDPYGVVKSVNEIFLDLHPVADQTAIIPLAPPQGGSSILSLNLNQVGKPWNPLVEQELEPSHVDRIVQGMAGLFLMGKRRPQLRYRSGSKCAQRIAQDLSSKLRSLRFSFPDVPERESICIILDRKDDPVTPLLSQWTYQSMIHEIIGIQDGKVTVDSDPNSTRPIEERVIVLSKHHDSFFAEHRLSNFGDACTGLQSVVAAYQEVSKATSDLRTATLEDLKNFVNKAPNVRQQSVIALRHTELLTTLDEAVRQRSLLEISLVEQEMAAKDNHKEHANALRDIIADKEKYQSHDVLRLVLLYVLRYQNQPDHITTEIKRLLEKVRGFSEEKVELLDKVINYAGSHRRVGDCFRPNSSAGKLKTFVKAMAGFQSDASAAPKSIYTQHEPWMKKILNSLYNDVLPTTEYPFMHIGSTDDGTTGSHSAESSILYPKTVFVFVVGGMTYEESLLAEQINLGQVDNKPPPPEGGGAGSWSERLAGGGGGGGSGGGDDTRGTGTGGVHIDHSKAPGKLNPKLLIASTEMLTSGSFIEHMSRQPTKASHTLNV